MIIFAKVQLLIYLNLNMRIQQFHHEHSQDSIANDYKKYHNELMIPLQDNSCNYCINHLENP